MTDDMMNPAICSSALDEEGNNAFADDINGGRHIWYDTTTPNTCAECGTTRDEDTDTMFNVNLTEKQKEAFTQLSHDEQLQFVKQFKELAPSNPYL